MLQTLIPMSIAVATLAVNGDDHMGDWDGGWWIVMFFMMVVFWAAVIGLAVWAIRSFSGPRDDRRTPLDIARERLAKGEIAEEEFERIKRQLS